MGRTCSTYRGDERYIQGFGGKTRGEEPRGKRKSTWEDNIKMDLREVGIEHGLDLSGSEYREVTGFCECGTELSGSRGEFLD